MSNSKHYCRVCGYYNADLPWGEDGSIPSFNICDCCGTEFGYHDFTLTGIRKQREAWLFHPEQWNNLLAKPENWDIHTQVKNIPEEFI